MKSHVIPPPPLVHNTLQTVVTVNSILVITLLEFTALGCTTARMVRNRGITRGYEH